MSAPSLSGNHVVLLADETEPRYRLTDVGGPDTNIICKGCGRLGIRFIRVDVVAQLEPMFCQACITAWSQEIVNNGGKVVPTWLLA